MNQLKIGFQKDIELPQGEFLYINDDLPNIKGAKIFDPLKHSFNPLQAMTKTKARRLAEIFYTINPQGENTLTVRDGKRALTKALFTTTSLDKVNGTEEVEATIDDILFSDVLPKVLCSDKQFSFNANWRSVILARINRAELGDRDALILGLLLIEQFNGQIIVPEFDFYGRDIHIELIKQNRLIAGVYTLNALSPKLRQAVLLIEDKTGRKTTYDDAETLARYSHLMPGTNAFNDFIEDAIA